MDDVEPLFLVVQVYHFQVAALFIFKAAVFNHDSEVKVQPFVNVQNDSDSQKDSRQKWENGEFTGFFGDHYTVW